MVEKIDIHGWKAAFRSRDAAGSPETAGHVAWEWINELARRADAFYPDPNLLEICMPRVAEDAQVITLYRSTQILAAATVIRDQMNFAVLVRWIDEDFERSIDQRPKCSCWETIREKVKAGGTCAMGGCPYGGDF